MTPKQDRFVHEYVIDFNGRQAAIRAGYAASSAARSACDLLKRDSVQNKIKELGQQFSAAAAITKEQVVSKIAMIAFDDETETKDRLKALELLLKHLEKEGPEDDGFEVRHVFEFEHNERDEPV